MEKPILVVTHERSGTHLTINIINSHRGGEFYTLGFLPENNGGQYSLRDYTKKVYRDSIVFSYDPSVVLKSHHQVEFFNEYLDFILEKYRVVYVKRDVKDVLVSYYRFLFPDEMEKPPFDEWVWMSPKEVGKKYLSSIHGRTRMQDPHVFTEPENYIDRWRIHTEGWEKFRDKILFLEYEKILEDFPEQKKKIEDFIGRKISAESIPDPRDKNLPNFSPNEGTFGSHLKFMSPNLILKIDQYLRHEK